MSRNPWIGISPIEEVERPVTDEPIPPVTPCPLIITNVKWPNFTGRNTSGSFNPNGRAWSAAAWLSNPTRLEVVDLLTGCITVVTK